MSQKIDQQQQAGQLLQARQEALGEMRHGKIRPHGKLWGMDVFSWPNPDHELLCTTIGSFPFPVVWLGTGEQMMDCLERHSELTSNLKSVVAYPTTDLIFKLKNLVAVPEVVGVESMQDALIMVKGLQTSGTILLFTTEGAEWERELADFVNFIDLHQGH